jgi:hypothetical protein
MMDLWNIINETEKIEKLLTAPKIKEVVGYQCG